MGRRHGFVPLLRHAGATAALAVALGSGSAGAAPPEIDYMLNCQGCHLSDGQGFPGSVPDLRGAMGRFAGVPGGRAYLVQVPGSRNAPIDDAALAAVLNWMMDTFSASTRPADYAPFTREEVARARAESVVDIAGRRAALLGAMGSSAP
jgi:mono/diheme cytochrome c family protein